MGNIYIGASNIARKIKSAYVGVDGVARKVKQVYIGDANGKARLVWSAVSTVSKLLTSTSYDNYVYPPFDGNDPDAMPSGYELYQPETIFPLCDNKVFGLLTVDSTGKIISQKKMDIFDQSNSTRNNVIIVDSNNYYSISHYGSYQMYYWYNSILDTYYSSTVDTSSAATVPGVFATTGDGYLVGIDNQNPSGNQYKFNVVYPYSSYIAYTATLISKQHTQTCSINPVMLTPNKGVIYEYYYDAAKYYLKSFSRNDKTITIHQTIEITQVAASFCRGIKMVDSNRFFLLCYDHLLYYYVDDNYQFTLIDYISMPNEVLRPSCRIGKTNSFIIPKTSDYKTTYIISFTENAIINHGTYVSNVYRGNYHSYPFGEKSIISFTAGSSSSYIKTTVETFE